MKLCSINLATSVSTHSRLKAAGTKPHELPPGELVSTHSRLKAAGYVSKILSRK